jgi:hypothetical protein
MNRDNNHETNHHTPIPHQSPTDDDWSLNKCMAIHDANAAMRTAETAAQIREMREEQNYRSRDRELKEGMTKSEMTKSEGGNYVPQWQKDAYRRNGIKELEKTVHDKLMESVFIALLLVVVVFILHFIH